MTISISGLLFGLFCLALFIPAWVLWMAFWYGSDTGKKIRGVRK